MDSMDDLNVEELMRPFDASQIRQRMGPGRKPLDYISGPDVIRRLLDATGNHFTWNVERVQMVVQDTANGGSASLWIVHGTLSVDTLGSRSGVGTHPADSVEAAKAAETDALKRAALKFGVGLHLYEDDAGATPQPPQAQPSPAPPQNGGNGNGYNRNPSGNSSSSNGNGNNGYGGNENGGGGYSGSRRSHNLSYEGSPDPNGVGSHAPF